MLLHVQKPRRSNRLMPGVWLQGGRSRPSSSAPRRPPRAKIVVLLTYSEPLELQ